MTKEEKIKEAWDNTNKLNTKNWANSWTYEEAKKYDMDENGWITVCGYEPGLGSVCTPMRPPQLKGVENNNGWIKIENEKDLPIFLDNVYYNLHDIDNNETVYYKTYDDLEFMWKKGIITHYKKMLEEKPPIY